MVAGDVELDRALTASQGGNDAHAQFVVIFGGLAQFANIDCHQQGLRDAATSRGVMRGAE